jgi:hypothetical protein
LSKKITFLLHRILTEDDDDKNLAQRATQRAHVKLHEVQACYAQLKDELAGDRFWRYQRQVSPGLQEYIEALSLTHYLEHGTLVTFEQVQASLSDEDGVHVRVTVLFSFQEQVEAPKRGTIAAADFERLTPHVHELSKKQIVTAQSLEKIEDGMKHATLSFLASITDHPLSSVRYCRSKFRIRVVIRSARGSCRSVGIRL